MSESRLTYFPREDATPEGELCALVAAYRYILQCHERKRAVKASAGEKGGEHEGLSEPPQKQMIVDATDPRE